MFDREHRTLAHVPRWAILRVNRRQSVAEHSFFVALYAVEIAKFLDWEGPYDQLMMHALAHDMGEIVTGDIPSPVKRAMSPAEKDAHDLWVKRKMLERSSRDSAYAMADPGDQARAIVKLADHLETVIYLADERSQGNRNTVNMESYVAQRLERYYKTEFVPLFKLNLSHLHKGGILWSHMLDAVSRAAAGHDRLVSE